MHDRRYTWLLLLSFAAPGCAQHGAVDSVPTWELANAEPIRPRTLARVRLDWSTPLPKDLAQSLSPEFTLLVVHRARDWAELARLAPIPTLPSDVDLDAGCVIGLVGDLGEATENRWPIQIRSVRIDQGYGAVTATIRPGLYYPVRTAGYLELAFVPRLRTVTMVRINQRVFLLPTANTFHGSAAMLLHGNVIP